MSFVSTLENAGWVAQQESVQYRKGNWVITFDTSNWIEVGTTANPRIFDVPVPEQRLEQWSVNLIEYLCKTDDQVQKLK